MFKKIFKRSGDNNQPSTTPQPETASQTLDTEKIKAIIAELNGADELFKEAGFVMQRLEIAIGLVSIITPCFTQTHLTSSEQEKQLLQQAGNKNITGFVLLSLFKSSRMKSLMDETPMEFHSIEIDITTSPLVKTIFKRNDLADYDESEVQH